MPAGLTVSTVHWAVIDAIHHRTGIRRPQWDFSRLRENLRPFDLLVEVHYRYYQFYSNMLVALTFGYLAQRAAIGLASAPDVFNAAFPALGVLFFVASRDTLRKYYDRTDQLLRADTKRTDRTLLEDMP